MPFRQKIFYRIKSLCGDKILGLHLRHNDKPMGCFITPCTHPNGVGYRLNYYDDKGIGRHENYSLAGMPYLNESDVLMDAINRGFILFANETIDTVIAMEESDEKMKQA